jgi:hypothetical protein
VWAARKGRKVFNDDGKRRQGRLSDPHISCPTSRHSVADALPVVRFELSILYTLGILLQYNTQSTHQYVRIRCAATSPSPPFIFFLLPIKTQLASSLPFFQLTTFLRRRTNVCFLQLVVAHHLSSAITLFFFTVSTESTLFLVFVHHHKFDEEEEKVKRRLLIYHSSDNCKQTRISHFRLEWFDTIISQFLDCGRR